STLRTNNNPLNLTTGSLILSAVVSFDSGTAPTTITASPGTSITVGDAIPGGLHLANADLGRIAASSLTLQTTGPNDDISVAGVTPHSAFGPLFLSTPHVIAFQGSMNLGTDVVASAGVSITQQGGTLTATSFEATAPTIGAQSVTTIGLQSYDGAVVLA